MFVNLCKSYIRKKILLELPLNDNIYLCIMQYNIFFHISRRGHCEVLQEILVFKIQQKDEAAVFFQGFPHVDGQFFKTSFADIFRNIIFLQCNSIYKGSKVQQPVGSAHEVLTDSSETAFDEAHIIVNQQSFLQSPALPRYTVPPSESFVPYSPRQKNFQELLSSRHSIKEFNNQGLKVNRNLNAIFFACHQKAIRNRQALPEIIRASSLSIIFVGLSFKPVYPTMVVKNFKFMENYNSWNMYLQVKIDSRYFYSYVTTRSLPSSISPSVSDDHDLEYQVILYDL